jgi:cell division septation protein DedD
MLEAAPARAGTLTITRGHLTALGVLSVALATLAFIVGFEAGRSQARVVQPAPEQKPLVGEEARTGNLEALLARVEQARGGSAPLAFPAELPATELPVAPAVGPDGAPIPPAPEPPPPDPFPDAQRPGSAVVAASPATVSALTPDPNVPQAGWAVQVATRASESEAAALVETLRGAALNAYRIVTVVDGAAAWRVRVGGYASKEAAASALAEVGRAAAADGATVTKAP